MKKEQFNFIKEVRDFFVKRFSFNVDVAGFIGCQFALESNYGKSKLACNLYNYSGMKVAVKRISCQKNLESDTVFARYETPHYCCIDYVLRLQYFSKNSCDIQELEAFKKFLIKSKYCPEKDYIDRINNIYKQFKNYQNGKTS